MSLALNENSRQTPAKVCGIYTRISHDRRDIGEDGGTVLKGLGVKRQRKDCEAEAKRRGWTVHDVYQDNDISAYSGKRRPAYERLLADIKAGRIEAVIVWDVDRLHRSPRELEDFVPLIEATGAVVVSVSGGDYDLETADGRFKARIMGAVARKESEDKSRRQKRKALEIAQAGRPKGGGMRGYGYAEDKVTVIDSEAEAIREAVARVLAGSSVRSIIHDFAARGVPTTTGSPWTLVTLNRIIRSARVAGWRESHGEWVAPAVWPAIVSREDVERVRAILDDPARRKAGRRRKYLLTGGMARCGKCHKPLVGRGGEYYCSKELQVGGCGGVYVAGHRLETTVVDLIAERINDPAISKMLATGKPTFVDERKLVASITADEEQLTDLADLWAAGKMTKAGYVKAEDRISSRLAESRRKLSEVSGPSPASVVALHGGIRRLRKDWPDMEHGDRRTIINGFLEAVEVMPVGAHGTTFRPERVVPLWRR